MCHTKSIYVIAHRHAKWRRLNDRVFSSQHAAKDFLDEWEQTQDPQRENWKRHDEMNARHNPYAWAKNKPVNHNDRDFEVVDIESHINNVACLAHERGATGTPAPFNTTKFHSP